MTETIPLPDRVDAAKANTPRAGEAEVDDDSLADDVEPGNGKPKAQKESLEPAIMLLVAILLAVTLCFGVVGAVKTHSGPSTDAPADIFQDATFSLILSQITPNILHGILELIKARKRVNAPWGNRYVFFGVNIIIIGLSIAAPIFYGSTNRDKSWAQVVTIILSMTAALFIIMAGLFGVMEARRINPDSLSVQLSTARADLEQAQGDITALQEELDARRSWLRRWGRTPRSERRSRDQATGVKPRKSLRGQMRG